MHRGKAPAFAQGVRVNGTRCPWRRAASWTSWRCDAGVQAPAINSAWSPSKKSAQPYSGDLENRRALSKNTLHGTAFWKAKLPQLRTYDGNGFASWRQRTTPATMHPVWSARSVQRRSRNGLDSRRVTTSDEAEH